jgi:nucleoside-diphosphate-sugar epimerase
MKENTWIVGCGDLGLRVARRLQAEGAQPNGAVRSGQSAHRLVEAGVQASVIDLDHEAPAADGAVYWFAPPPPEGETDPRLRRFLARADGVRRLLYLSTSGVYGDCDGRWIDEDEPIKPRSARGRRRADSEAALAEWRARTGGDYVTVRVPGIYGPGRLPLERLQSGKPLLRVEDSPYTNRIHIEDLAVAAIAAMQHGRSGRAYNTADGQPTTMTDYFLRCAELLGLPAPPQLPREQARQQMTPAMWSFMEENKRLSIARMLDELHVSLAYSNLALGLPACLEVPTPEE